MKLLSKIKFKDKDNRIVISNILGAFLIKGLAMIISLWTVPAFLSYFDNTTYLGIWYTVLSVIMWFLTFDFGIGNGVRNKIVKSIIEKDHERMRTIISSGFFVSIIFSLLMFIVAFPIIKHINWNSVYNISPAIIPLSVLREITILLYLTILIRFILVTIISLFYALQLSSINNLLAFLSSCLIFLFVKFSHYEDPQLALRNVAIAYAVLYNLPIVIGGIILFMTKLKHSIPKINSISLESVKEIFSIGGLFFVCQILFTILTCSDQFLITKIFDVKYTVDYTFYYRLTSVISIIIALGTTPLWSMITKAMEQGKFKWIVSLFKRLKWLGFLIICIQLIFIPCLQPVMNLWLGDRSIEVNYMIALAFALYGSLFSLNKLLATFACGLGILRTQLIWYTVGCILKFVIVFGCKDTNLNWSIVIWSDVLAFTPYVLIQYFELTKYFKLKSSIITP